MLVKKIITIFKNFPKRHSVVILFCLIILVSIVIIGNFDLSEQREDGDLAREFKIDILKEQTKIDAKCIVEIAK